MVFSSILFLFLFLPASLLLYCPLRHHLRAGNALLLIVSLFFYFWGETTYTLVLLAYIYVNYAAAHLIARSRAKSGSTKGSAKLILLSTISFDIGLLLYFKYSTFLLGNFYVLIGNHNAAQSLNPVHLPIGISFFAFQAISYVIDVYREEVKPSNSLLDFAMYKAFFPQLIAGPIVRYRDVSHQVTKHLMTTNSFVRGFSRFCLGLGKKVLIANSMGTVADEIFNIPGADLTTALAWLGIVTYTLQIYFDFSGYSDMAIGLARMFGFRFLENFNYPYIAQSLRDFWRRWHISLSSWFRDYLYIPLGGNRGSAFRNNLNLVIVFSLCGLWHGASWTFVVWGLWHGMFLILERGVWGKMIDAAWRPLRHLYTLLAVLIAWVFFRSENLPQALHYLAAMAGLADGDGIVFSIYSYLDYELITMLVLGSLFSAPIVSIIQRQLLFRFRKTSNHKFGLHLVYEVSRAITCLLIMFLSVLALASGTHNPFIYFRF